MTTELTLLAWSVVIGVVQLMLASLAIRRQNGLQWAVSARDGESRPPQGVAGRLQRAEDNLMETWPFFAALVLIAHVAGLHTGTILLGCQLYVAARVVYLPLYALGVPVLRSLVWMVSFIGLLMVLYGVLSY
ncbi:hypothetical protein IGB42_01664 [Andreprevotia sp. IGB-42]|uniref:MAPEG family protein n=1 Tax=Andreprevotia sp. IGB-42 TaxID=2497473 RepID=UPI00135C0F40|nr:MAPEG family protein [Andreprevotia sp. IGB-42]KAF0813985.1 hypothetical protein IGB42_01664 [Andreprevotia sp. IGB-42]